VKRWHASPGGGSRRPEDGPDRRGDRWAGGAFEENEVIDEDREGLDRQAVKWAVKEALDELLGLGEARLASRFEGGALVLKPAKADAQEKSIPIAVFFHKITMVRDRLRVLEQRINNHPKLNENERVELQQYVTRVYGSLTSFNVLFKEKDDWFIGSRDAAERPGRS
jgi:hypothetical protein